MDIQRLAESCAEVCKSLCLNVNVGKSKVMIGEEKCEPVSNVEVDSE